MSTRPEEEKGPSIPEQPDPFYIYLNEVGVALPAMMQDQFVAASFKVLEESFPGGISGPANWALFYNQVGYTLNLAQPDNPDVIQSASELYAMAFETELPFRPGTHIADYAINFIQTYAGFINRVQQPTPARMGWIRDRKPTLERAAECITHFRNVAVYQEGLRQAPRQPGNPSELAGEWDAQALALVTEYFAVGKIVTDLTAGPLKFI